MGKKEQVATNPPAYEDENVPTYERPKFAEAEGSNQLMSAMARFPPKMESTLTLTATGLNLHSPNKDVQFYVTLQRLFTRRPMSLHSGESKDSPIIASVDHKKGKSRFSRSTVQVFPDTTKAVEVEMTGDLGVKHAFSMPVGSDGRLEQFEWRTTYGKEVQETAGKKKFIKAGGWKLVRLRGPETGARGEGFSSSGEEIVAVVAMVDCITTGPNLAFMGTGLTGTFGEVWEIVVVMTFLRVWDIQRSLNATVGALAGNA